MKHQHPIENCPLRTFGCITTSDTPPYRILDIDLIALDLFLSGYSPNDHYTQINFQPPSSPNLYPDDQQFDHFEQLTHARAKALRFLKGLNVSDVLLSDPQSFYSSTSSDPSSNLQSFIIAEEAILTNRRHQNQTFNAKTRHIHACIHYSSTSQHTPYHNNSSSSSNGGQRFYLVKDVTDMHGLAVAARSEVRLCGSLGQPQQPFCTQRCRERGTEHELECSNIVPPPSNQQLRKKEEKVISHRDSGIMLNDEYNSWSVTTTGSKSIHASATTTTNLSSLSSMDPGLLILQVTRFGTIDHAFAIPQSDQDHDNVTIKDDQSLFLAQDRSSIETMANGSIMAHVHPQDLAMFCKGLDQVCKALYISFRVRWRVHAFVECEEDEDEKNKAVKEEAIGDADEKGLIMMAEGEPKIIEFQGELFEEWVDPCAAVNKRIAPPPPKEEYVWTQVTGVLSNGSPILVVRPLTLSEALKQDASRSTTAASRNNLYFDYYDPFVDAHSDDDEGYLEMEMEQDTTLSSSQGHTALLEWGAQKDQGWKRMDLGEGLILSQSGVQGFSDLKEMALSDTSLDSDHAFKYQQHQRHNGQRHIGPEPLFLFTFSPMAVLASWPTTLSSAAFDARKQWIHTVHLTRDQFQAWCEYLLDAALDQTIKSVTLGMTILGYPQCFPVPPPCSTECKQEQHQESTMIQAKKQCTAEQSTPKLSGLHRAGKVLEANCPALDGVVRQIGKSWIGQRIIVKSRIDQRLDVVADQVVDWWENQESVAASLTASIPLLNKFTAYTPLSYWNSKSKRN
ncbi:hypothetical protein BGZ49_007158 [Haplosporangium sp. Z 27]|nr:hypothetical protein BGZ49_007158 [Haplosporangium sp. Z 27]